MSKPFDATLKDLIESFPLDWLGRLGVPITGPVEVLSPELSTVTAAADVLIRVGEMVVHIEAQSGPDAGLPARVLLYNVLAHRATGLPVHSVAVLLRANANHGDISGNHCYAPRPGGGLDFRFEVVRVWETPADELMASGIGLLPLAVLGRPPRGQSRREAFPAMLEAIAGSAHQQLSQDHARRVIVAALILAGMHLTVEQVKDAARRLPDMIDTVTFQVFEEMGAEKQARKTLFQLGEAMYGKPTDEQKQRLQAIEDLERLNRLIARLLKVKSWDALLRGR